MFILHIIASLKDKPCSELPEAARRTLEKCQGYVPNDSVVYVVIFVVALIAIGLVLWRK